MSRQATHTDSSPEVIVYGGSFDPPHNGHVQMIEAAMGRFPAAQIVVVPAYAPSIAGMGTKAVVASFVQRLAMAKLAFTGIAPKKVTVSSVEQELPTPSYTINTLRILATNTGAMRLALLLGQDQFEALPKWHEPKSILNLSDVIVVPRVNDNSSSETLVEVSAKVGNALDLGLDWNDAGDCATTIDGSNIHILSSPVCPASSSDIRNKIRSGDQVPANWLPVSVRHYIDKNQLYRHSEVNS